MPGKREKEPGAEAAGAPATQAPSKGLSASRRAAAFLACAVVAAVLGAAIATAALLPASQEADRRAGELEQQLAAAEQGQRQASAEQGQAGDVAQAACEHEWRTLGLFEQTDAVVRTEEIPEVTEVVDVPHTVCNTCFAIVDGETEAHTEQTGHAGFSTDVPIPTTVVTREASTEEVVEQPAEQRFTPVLDWCPICGQTRAAAASGE